LKLNHNKVLVAAAEETNVRYVVLISYNAVRHRFLILAVLVALTQ